MNEANAQKARAEEHEKTVNELKAEIAAAAVLKAASESGASEQVKKIEEKEEIINLSNKHVIRNYFGSL